MHDTGSGMAVVAGKAAAIGQRGKDNRGGEAGAVPG